MSGYASLPDPEKLPPPSGKTLKQKSPEEKVATLIDGFSNNLSPEAQGCLKQCKPVITGFIKVVLFVTPYYVALYKKIYEVYQILPTHVIQMIFGLALCFFGGTYVAGIAAVEAFRQLGWQKVHAELVVVYDQVQLVIAANQKDDAVDADKDGVADVDQMEANELAQRKLKVALTAITEPNRLQAACGSLFASYLAVLATLRLEFARTTAFALGLVEMAKVPIVRIVAPVLAATLGEELKHWTQTVIETSLTLFAVIFAWFLQMIISAFYSGIRGGKMFADGAIAYLTEKDLMSKVPLIQQPFDPDESYLDDAVGYGLAAVGFGFQIFNGFALPFPLNIVFLPLTILEWFLRIQISMESSPGVSG